MIDSAPNLVNQLQLSRRQLTALVSEAVLNASLVDEFVQALLPTYLDKNIDAVNTALVDVDPSTSQLTGALEENAFLASFQNAYTCVKRRRCGKWASIHSVLKADASPEGPMESQLKFIGVNVEEEFLTDVLKINQSADIQNARLARLNADQTLTFATP